MLNIGTISHGTLLPQDLLKSFAETLVQYEPEEANKPEGLYAEAMLWAGFDAEDGLSDENFQMVYDLLDELTDRLESLAARYGCHFGCTEGDGSDFGFWPNED